MISQCDEDNLRQTALGDRRLQKLLDTLFYRTGLHLALAGARGIAVCSLTRFSVPSAAPEMRNLQRADSCWLTNGSVTWSYRTCRRKIRSSSSWWTKWRKRTHPSKKTNMDSAVAVDMLIQIKEMIDTNKGELRTRSETSKLWGNYQKVLQTARAAIKTDRTQS